MANYCSNSVRFLGPATAIDQIRAVFENIENQQQRTNRYHLPDFVQGGMGYMEDIAIGPDWISYETRSVPNLEVLDDIADHYRVDYIAWYTEPMAGLISLHLQIHQEKRRHLEAGHDTYQLRC